MRLTDKELEILSLSADGLNSRQISEQTHRKLSTVKSQKSVIVRKLHVRNIEEAVYSRVHEIARWRREHGHSDETIDSMIGFTSI